MAGFQREGEQDRQCNIAKKKISTKLMQQINSLQERNQAMLYK